jgi:hypothetical protein
MMESHNQLMKLFGRIERCIADWPIIIAYA